MPKNRGTPEVRSRCTFQVFFTDILPARIPQTRRKTLATARLKPQISSCNELLHCQESCNKSLCAQMLEISCCITDGGKWSRIDRNLSDCNINMQGLTQITNFSSHSITLP